MPDEATVVTKAGEPTQQPLSDATTRKIELECKKIEAERHKIETETSHLKGKLFWLGKICAALSTASPAIVSIVAAVILYNSRWFDSQSKSLEIDRKYLMETNVLLQAKAAEINRSIHDFETVRDSLTNANTRLAQELKAKDKLLGEIRSSLSNEVVKANSAGKETAIVLFNEIKRVEAQRDAVVRTNQTLLSQFRGFAAAIQKGQIQINAGSDIRIDQLGALWVIEPSAVRVTEDGSIRTDENGNLRVLESATNSPQRARQK